MPLTTLSELVDRVLAGEPIHYRCRHCDGPADVFCISARPGKTDPFALCVEHWDEACENEKHKKRQGKRITVFYWLEECENHHA